MTELQDLVGKHTLDAVDFTTEKFKMWGEKFWDAEVCRFRLDGVAYVAAEDPGDGYRSHMRDLVIDESVAMTNVFPPIEVLARYREKGEHGYVDEVLELVDVVTGKVVLEVGTSNTEDYYPFFVASFHPENMDTNA